VSRQLDWEGCANVRDLGGLPTVDGGEVRRGAVVRGDAPDHLSPAGWAALREHGVRTIVDLRNDDERGHASVPAGLDRVHVPLDGVEDTEFWAEWAGGPQFGTPLYYGPHLDRFPERSAQAIAAIARARPGGVLVHCVGGRDRAGQVSMLLLALAGVAPDEIAADYCLSGWGEGDDFLAGQRTSATEVIVSLLAELDAEAQLRRGGLSDADLNALRSRLVRY
jgi:protein-tyrosine phosphatase